MLSVKPRVRRKRCVVPLLLQGQSIGWGTRVSRTLQSVRGKRVDMLSFGAVVDSQIELLLPKQASQSSRWPIEPTTPMPGRCQLKPSTSISHRCLLDAEINSTSLPGRLGGTQSRCQNDPGMLQGYPGVPEELRGTICGVPGAPRERSESAPGMP